MEDNRDKESNWEISESGEQFCPFCSYSAQWEDDNFCAHCGAKLNPPESDQI